jgi:type IV secretion system protein VirB4
MPNPKATREDYVDGFHCSVREWEIIKSLPEGSRKFLIKQGHNSVVAELNLKGFDDELAVLSGTAANNALVDKIIAEVGDDPDVWLPIFHERRKAA